MKLIQKNLPRIPSQQTYIDFVGRLMNTADQMKFVLPKARDFEIVLSEGMIEISAFGKVPFHQGCMVPSSNEQNDPMVEMFRESLGKDLHSFMSGR